MNQTYRLLVECVLRLFRGAPEVADVERELQRKLPNTFYWMGL